MLSGVWIRGDDEIYRDTARPELKKTETKLSIMFVQPRLLQGGQKGEAPGHGEESSPTIV
jgi:hypothetical protein